MIEQLKQDLKQVIAAIPSGPLVTAGELADYLRNNLVPFVESLVDDVGEIDESVFALVHEAEDILHSENATVFAALITSSTVLVDELRKRVGNDNRLLRAINEHRQLAGRATEILNEITVPDDDEEPEQGSDAQPIDAAQSEDPPAAALETVP